MSASRTSPRKRFSIRPYTDALRRYSGNWVLDYDSRSGGARVVALKKSVSTIRVLHLQLWDDGKHRVTFTEGGRMATPPTDFTDVDGMLAAIAVETLKPPAPLA